MTLRNKVCCFVFFLAGMLLGSMVYAADITVAARTTTQQRLDTIAPGGSTMEVTASGEVDMAGSGDTAIWAESNGWTVTIQNGGQVTGGSNAYGIVFNSAEFGLGTSYSGTVVNNGTISSPFGAFGIVIGGGSITNNSTGSISAEDYAIYVHQSVAGLTLTNYGTISKTVVLGSSDDTVVLHAGSVTSGALNAGAGTDSIEVNGTGSCSGSLSNFESLEKTGAGVWTLSGNSTYSGATTISAGTLRVAGGNGIGNSSAVTVNTGTTLDVNNTSETIGSLVGAGDVTLGSGTLTTGGDNTSTTFSGVISETGGLTKSGSGTLTLSGDNTYTGATTVSAGTLAVGGSITSPVIISSSGTLGGTGTLKSVTNNGTIAPGNSIGTLTINGSYTHNAGSDYEVEVNAAGSSDLIDVIGSPGTATINGGTVDVQAASGSYGFSTDYTILQTAGGVTGTFDTVTSNLAFLDPSLSYDASKVYLTLTRNNNDFAGVAQTSNQLAVGTALDNAAASAAGDMVTVLNAVTGLSASQARSAYGQIGGASHAACIHTSFANTAQYIQTIFKHIMTSGEGGRLGAESMSFSGPMLAMNDNGTMTTTDVKSPLFSSNYIGGKKGNSPWSIWADVYGLFGDRRGNDIASEYDYTIAGATAGVERQFSDTVVVGVSGGYSATDLDFDNLTDSAEVDSYQVTLHGSYDSGAWYTNGVLYYAFNQYDTSRGISFGGLNRAAKGDYDGDEISVYLESGRLFNTPNKLQIQPLGSIQVAYLSQDGYTETGADALNLELNEQNTTSVVGTLGVRVAREFTIDTGVILRPELRARWAHEFSNEDYAIDGRFDGSAAGSFMVKGEELDRDRAILGVGLTGMLGENLGLSLNYDAQLGNDYTAHAVAASLKYDW